MQLGVLGGDSRAASEPRCSTPITQPPPIIDRIPFGHNSGFSTVV
jgi:hypothetical protein